ncbi:MAG TPA: hypothetical protein VNT52_10810, partial [Acidimicrobiales bacterium]|nr:hypothetical protein [Acidimicrobiales bacterium]
MDIHISEKSVPGLGRRYELALGGARSLSLVVQHAGPRHIAVLGEGADEPEFALSLDHEQAVALAALLIGARVTMGTADDDSVPG